MYTVIKSNTKKGQGWLWQASHCDGYTIHDVYAKPSSAKWQAYHYCLRLCAAECGQNFRIISHNTFRFTAAWETAEGLRIETASNSYLVVAV